MTKRSVVFILVLAMLPLTNLAALAAVAAPAPPALPFQPVTGPGGQEYAFEGVVARRYGAPPTGYWLFQPETPLAGEQSQPLPIVVFLHGFTALDPDHYRSWIDHLVKRGAVVVYPDYQTDDPFATPANEMLPNTVAAIRDAVARLVEGTPEVETGSMALVGHSLGGVLATALAAVAESEGLPLPAVLMPMNPGGCRGCGGPGSDRGVPLPDLAAVPGDSLVALVTSEDDAFVGDQPARTIWARLASVPMTNRDFVVLRSDVRGAPRLVADHVAPETGTRWGTAREDALDWYGTWKQLDLLLGCAFAAQSCEDALGNSDVQRFMGVWSDGVTVRELAITDDPLASDAAP